MKRMNAVKKLRSRAGETILETLVATLISALALTMLAGAIAATNRIVQNSDRKMMEYYSVNNAIVRSDGASLGALASSGTVGYSASMASGASSSDSPTFIFASTGGTADMGSYFINNAFSNRPIMVYSFSATGGGMP